MTRTYSIPGIIEARITTTSGLTTCSAHSSVRIADTDAAGLMRNRTVEFSSKTRPKDCELQAILDVVDQMDSLFAQFGRTSILA